MDIFSSVKDLVQAVLPFLEQVPFLRVLIGIALVFFLPGFTWSMILLKKLTILERIALSIGLSFAIVTLSVFAANYLLSIRVNWLNSLVIIILITVLPVIWHYLNRLMFGKSPVTGDAD